MGLDELAQEIERLKESQLFSEFISWWKKLKMPRFNNNKHAKKAQIQNAYQGFPSALLSIAGS
jgi:hypothetical protein